MARGRNPTTMRTDRYPGSYSYGDSHGTSLTDELELAEEDIWSPAVIHHTETTEDSYGGWNLRASSMKSGRVGGLSLTFKSFSNAPSSSPMLVQHIHGGAGEGEENLRSLASSAPVNVPDWSKIYRVNLVEPTHELDDDDEEEPGMMPPHEYLAKSQARRSRKMGGSGASLFEGVGRTLKGRELRRVRDAIWSQTGFYG
ncbi:hypothetical protein HA466_0020290 [Hirschfeldia incana]|nr:hypothetical protein HA466_0020290 [Hirschfeldia incana]